MDVDIIYSVRSAKQRKAAVVVTNLLFQMQGSKKNGRTAKDSFESQEIDSLPEISVESVLNKSKRSSRSNLRLRYSPVAERSMQKRIRKGPSLNVFQKSDLYEFVFLNSHTRGS